MAISGLIILVFLAVWGGEPGGARTRDHRLKRPVLYQLSYRLIYFTTLRLSR